MAKPKAKLKKVEVKLGGGPLGVAGTWEADEAEINAAWELYVELCTRITVARLNPNEGTLRETLNSLHSLFHTTREVMRRHGPTVATPKGKTKELCFGFLSVSLLNNVLRPVLAKYHPLLLDYESTKPAGVSPIVHEQAWELHKELGAKLEEVRRVCIGFANCLADVAGIKSLIVE